jgi:integrase
MASEIINFTKESLAALQPAKKGFDTYRDKQEKGLIVTVTAKGVKTYYLLRKIEGKSYRIKIGRFPDLNAKEARELAGGYKNQIAKGVNPAEEKKKLSNEITFKELFDKYIEEYAKHNTKSWKDDIAEMDRKAKHLYTTKISKIKKEDISKLFNQLTITTGKGGANRFLDRLRAVFNKAIRDWGWEGINPAAGITKHKQKSRDRYLTKEEMPHFFNALHEEENEKITDYIWLCLLTGARKTNVLEMCWQDISFANETWHIPDTKNDDPQLVPLVPQAFDILKKRFDNKKSSKWVFESKTSATGHLEEPKKVWARIKQSATYKIWLNDMDLREYIEVVKKDSPKNASLLNLFEAIRSKAKKDKTHLPTGLMDLRLHDLRRSLGSWMAHTGASQYIIGKGLNHRSQKSTAIYARLSIDPVRESMKDAVNLMHGSK